MRFGLLGGTFNPVHYGHIGLAVEVQSYFCFDEMYFIPSMIPPHKSDKELVSVSNRCGMIIRALPSDFPFSLSRVDVHRGGLSYAIDTIIYFKSNLSFQDRLYFILGLDAFLEIHTWKAYKDVAKWIELIVVSRVGKWTTGDFNYHKTMHQYIIKNISSKYYFCLKSSCWNHETLKSIHYFDMKSSYDISSTLIRRNIKLGKDFSHFVPLTVADYIKKKELYI